MNITVGRETGKPGLERTLEAWQVEMPDDRFFINLPVVVREAAAASNPWWRLFPKPVAAVAAALLVVAALGAVKVEQERAQNMRLAKAAAAWATENYAWENIDDYLADLQDIKLTNSAAITAFNGLQRAVGADSTADYQDSGENGGSDVLGIGTTTI